MPKEHPPSHKKNGIGDIWKKNKQVIIKISAKYKKGSKSHKCGRQMKRTVFDVQEMVKRVFHSGTRRTIHCLTRGSMFRGLR